MKKHALSVVAILSLLVTMTFTNYAAPAGKLRVDIPFDFAVGKAKMPAGQYTVERTYNTRILLIRNLDGRTGIFSGIHGGQSSKKPSEAKLVFNRYGNQYFLSQVWEEGSTTAMQLPMSRAERKLAKRSEHLARNTAKPEVVTVMAQ